MTRAECVPSCLVFREQDSDNSGPGKSLGGDETERGPSPPYDPAACSRKPRTRQTAAAAASAAGTCPPRGRGGRACPRPPAGAAAAAAKATHRLT